MGMSNITSKEKLNLFLTSGLSSKSESTTKFLQPGG